MQTQRPSSYSVSLLISWPLRPQSAIHHPRSALHPHSIPPLQPSSPHLSSSGPLGHTNPPAPDHQDGSWSLCRRIGILSSEFLVYHSTTPSIHPAHSLQSTRGWRSRPLNQILLQPLQPPPFLLSPRPKRAPLLSKLLQINPPRRLRRSQVPTTLPPSSTLHPTPYSARPHIQFTIFAPHSHSTTSQTPQPLRQHDPR
jgi:hypothetical protein